MLCLRRRKRRKDRISKMKKVKVFEAFTFFVFPNLQKIRGEHRFLINPLRIAVPALCPIRKKTLVVRIVNRPDQHAVARRNRRRINFFPREKRKLPFVNFRRKCFYRFQTFKKEHEPMPASLVGTLGNHSEKMEIRRGNPHSGFLKRLAASTLKRRLAQGHFQFSADRTPTTFVRGFSPLNHQKFSVPVTDKNQYADFKRQNGNRR